MTWEAEAAAIAAVRASIGQPLTLRRPPSVDVTVYGTPRDYRDDEIGGDIHQGYRWVKISDAQIAANGWPGPPRRNDRLLAGGQIYTVQSCVTRYAGTSILSHTLTIAGGS